MVKIWARVQFKGDLIRDYAFVIVSIMKNRTFGDEAKSKKKRFQNKLHLRPKNFEALNFKMT